MRHSRNAAGGPGTRYLDRGLDDTAAADPATVRRIRDDIEHRIRGLLTELGLDPHP
ncbi:hypothetical protein [Nocardia testacea]|uniref:hypothetical protein n=1 Tax=Nocardia testacea TaxID=248551 RepID=UPI003405ED5B